MPNLNQELLNLLATIKEQESAIVKDNPGVSPLVLFDMHGNYILVPLIQAKAQVLAALTDLRISRLARKS